jgi:hypothetical protein
MTRATRFLGLAAGLLAAACGSTSSGGGTPGARSTGVATITGAATGTVNITVIDGNTTGSETYVTFELLGVASYPTFGFTAKFPVTSLQAGTFDASNTTQATSLYQLQSSATWGQVFLATSPATNSGTFSLTLSSVGSPTSEGSGAQEITDWYYSHGTYTGTLEGQPAGIGATGEVDVSITF